MQHDFETFDYIDSKILKKGSLVVRPVVKFTYKYSRNGYKARFSYPVNRLSPYVHYNPEDMAAYSADRYSARLLLELSAQF